MTADADGDAAGAHSDSVLDLLIVGGGPAGTAAAFRAKELGLSALVIDFDDLMKRIRDYSKDKLILPGFGGGDRMRFPEGGELVSTLCFDPIDKDDMCREWKDLYRRHGVEHRIGLELTALEPLDDGSLEARGWDHATSAEAALRARHVALCLGRGVPRRFDIPGNTDGIGFRLGDPASLVGQPACVIGGGTSAAEAVIAVSNAKAAAGDTSAVYWSYRGDRMPRISKALAEVFFEAYVGHGNIRYFPLSEPAAVVTTEDRSEVLSIRVDRRTMDGRPAETSHLEFPKEACIACIGEDLPEDLLGSCGISMVTGGPKNKKRMVVNRLLESCRPNVYLAGDILSQAHFETDDFSADPAGFREIKHRGNIKSALRDGVLIAEVVRQRLEGRSDDEIEVPADAAPPAKDAPPTPVPIDLDARRDALPEERLAPERSDSQVEGLLVRLLPTGVEAEEYPLASHSVTTIGRRGCDISLPDADMIADRHASVSHTEDGYFLRDDGSATGVFLQLAPAKERRLDPGDLLRVGRQFLRALDSNGSLGLVHYDQTGAEVARYAIGEKSQILGREAPDVTLDADDVSLSRRHLAVRARDGALFAKDLKSANGSYLRVRNALQLAHGDRFRLGQQLFVFTEGADSIVEVETIAPRPAATAVQPDSSEPDSSKPAGTGPSVLFKGAAERLAIAPDQTVCDVAEAGGLAITAECHSGICGSDPIRILSGRENLDAEPGDQERETLEDLCELEPGDCRLACMVRARGPVDVEIL